MKLLTYMRDNAITDQQFAEILGGEATKTTRTKIKKWKYGESRPSVSPILYSTSQKLSDGSAKNAPHRNQEISCSQFHR